MNIDQDIYSMFTFIIKVWTSYVLFSEMKKFNQNYQTPYKNNETLFVVDIMISANHIS